MAGPARVERAGMQQRCCGTVGGPRVGGGVWWWPRWAARGGGAPEGWGWWGATGVGGGGASEGSGWWGTAGVGVVARRRGGR